MQRVAATWGQSLTPARRRAAGRKRGCMLSYTGDMNAPVLESLLTCPLCGDTRPYTMPTDACQWYLECPACQTLLKPKPGDCCVFCSYGSVPCPPVQLAGRSGCCG